MAAPAEVLLTGGHLLTQDPATPVAEAMALAQGRILGVGTAAALEGLAGPATRRVDLAGRTVVPGFCDSHTHVWKVGSLLTSLVDLRPVESLEELTAALRQADAQLPAGAWLQGRGYNEARLKEGRRPSRADLDAAVPGRPVYLTRTCGHIGVASSAGLQAAGVTRDSVSPPGGEIPRDEAGEPTGELHETAMSLVTARIPAPAAAELEEMVLAACRHLLAQGITAATDAGCTPELLQVYRRLASEGRLPCRIHAMAIRSPLDGAAPPPVPEVVLEDFLRIDTVKLFADGGLSGATAALSVPYRCSQHKGLLRLDRDGLVELGRAAHQAGLRIAIHAIGDRAIDQSLDALEELQGGAPAAGGPRHRLEHCGLPSRQQLERMARLGVMAAPQAIFLDELGVNFRRYIPDAFLPRTYPLRWMLEAGVPFGLSSDAPVVRCDDPLRGMRAAVLRAAPGEEPLAPEQALTAAEALAAYTVGGAVLTGDGATAGRLAVGYRADLAVLSGDPLGVPPEELAELRVEETWLAGRVVHQA